MAPEASIDNSEFAIGSDTWTSVKVHDREGELNSRITTFLDNINWNALTVTASRHRGGVPCELRPSFSAGHFNMVRHVVYADGVSWIARLRLPELEAFFGSREALDINRSMRIEIATMKYIKSNTDIPVPELFHYDLDPNNDVGAPYMLMSYINAIEATELRAIHGCEPGLFGTKEQDRRFRAEMAKIQVQLGLLRFEQIGSLYHNDHDGSFYLGPELETGKGPWDTAAAYYHDLACHASDVCHQDASTDVREAESSRLPELFEKTMSLYRGRSSESAFGLANRDFGPHNILVDNDFNIVAVIDFDGVLAAPIEVVATAPAMAGLEVEPPGHIETRPMALARIKQNQHRIPEYRQFVSDAEDLAGSKIHLAKAMDTTTSMILRGLRDYELHDKNKNDLWLKYYKDLLTERDVNAC